MTKLTCVIPARSGSEGVMGKNFRPFADTSLVEITVALACEVFGRESVILSSDAVQAREIAERYECVFHERPSELSGAESQISELIKFLSDIYGFRDEDFIVLLEPTCPNRSIDDVKACNNILLNESDSESLVSVSEFSANSGKLLKLDSAGRLHAAVSKHYADGNRQRFPMEFLPDGAYFGFKLSRFRLRGEIPIAGSRAYVSSRPLIDINTLQDFKIAELIYKYAQKVEL